MRTLKRLFRGLFSPLTAFVLLLVVAAAVGYKLLRASADRGRMTDNAVAPKSEPPTAPTTFVERYSQKISNFSAPSAPPMQGKENEPPPIPDDIRSKLISAPTPISLYAPAPIVASPSPVPPHYYLPSHRLIRCQLITSPQTGSFETPLIGIVLEDQYNIGPDGVSRVVIPAGVEVHGTGRPQPVRDRIDGNGAWTFVWRTNDDNNAIEFTVPATALNRDFDIKTGVYGSTEKSPGLVGRRFETVTDSAIKEILLASLSATARAFKDFDSSLNPVTGGTIYRDKPTVRNAALSGASAGVDRLSSMIEDARKEIEERGYYLAIMAGKEFYLYTKEPIDLRKAMRPRAIVPPSDDASTTSIPSILSTLPVNPASTQ